MKSRYSYYLKSSSPASFSWLGSGMCFMLTKDVHHIYLKKKNPPNLNGGFFF